MVFNGFPFCYDAFGVTTPSTLRNSGQVLEAPCKAIQKYLWPRPPSMLLRVKVVLVNTLLLFAGTCCCCAQPHDVVHR